MARHSDAKERLIKAAHELIWENSYASVSVDAICERADARKGTFYHYFESKEDLALASLAVQWEDFQRGMNDAFSPLVAPLDRFQRIHDFAMVEQRERQGLSGRVCGCALFSLGCEIGTQHGPLRAKVEEILSAQRRYYESAIRDAVAAGSIPACDPAVQADLVQKLILGSLGLARILNSLEPLENILKSIWVLLGAVPPTQNS